MVVVATGTTKSTEEDKQRIRELMGPSTKMIDDGNPRALLKIVKDYSADILIAGGRNMYTALKAKVPFLDINQEREFGYAGYEGMLELARQLTPGDRESRLGGGEAADPLGAGPDHRPAPAEGLPRVRSRHDGIRP